LRFTLSARGFFFDVAFLMTMAPRWLEAGLK